MSAPEARPGSVFPGARRVAALLGALALAACAAPVPAPAPAPVQGASSPVPAMEPAPVSEPPMVAARPPEPAQPPPPRPQALMGLDETAVASLIGTPAFRRADAPGAIWRYQLQGCVLDLYLHGDGPGHRVVHYEFRPAGKSKVIDADACMAVLATRGTRPAGRP